MQKVCVIGLGYIGLPTASVLAGNGFSVYGVDVNEHVVSAIAKGEAHIYEPDLDEKVLSVVQSGNLQPSTKPTSADVFIIAVPTPFREGHVPDVSFVEAATRSIAPYVEAGNLVVLESTSPVGTTEQIAAWLHELRPDLRIPGYSLSETTEGEQIYVAHCPERVLPGKILKEIVENDRIIGGVDDASTRRAADFYRRFVSGELLYTNARTAELSKLTENAYRDVNIAFANELSLICDKLGIDVWELISLANHHPRVNILKPGPGVGGHCIAVDPWFIVDSAPLESKLIRAAREVNDGKPHFVVQKVREATKGFVNPTIACLGLSYKPDIDDLRESPAVEVTRFIAQEQLGRVLAVEPHVQVLPSRLQGQPNVQLAPLEVALEQADVVVLLVSHKVFQDITIGSLRGKPIIDMQGLWA